MSEQSGGNAQFGALLLLVPLVRAAAAGDLTADRAAGVVEQTGVEDAVGFYRAFEHVDVFVEDPPEGGPPDVRRGADAAADLRAAGLTFADVMAASAEADGVAAELVGGFERTFATAERILDAEGPAPDRAAAAFLDLLAQRPDTLVVKRHGPAVAEDVMARAARAREAGPGAVEALSDELVEAGVNPGATADVVAAALFVALDRGLVV